MLQFWYDTIYIALVVLLPLVPAILLYRVLPSKQGDAHLSGPLMGFKLNLSGALAAYGVVFLFMAWLYPSPAVEPEEIQIYRLKGHLALPDTTIRDWEELENQVSFSIRPPLRGVNKSNGERSNTVEFYLTFAFDTNPDRLDRPQAINVELGNCKANIPLEQLTESEPLFGQRDYDLEFTGESTITAKDTIELYPTTEGSAQNCL